MNIASAPGFLSYQFETEILLSKNTFVFLHDQDPKPSSPGRPNREVTGSFSFTQLTATPGELEEQSTRNTILLPKA
jgi:hypothetical protein